ncbi:MAG: twin-arginine translocase TatA/TatE family subunit [Acidimicrobiia bacterium]|nr:twin-arginine translocase TatA/TatE family subunit [Acidimicrobiia bacterium]
MLAVGLGTPEIIIIAGVVVLLFGSAALPKFARSLGQAKKEFESGISDNEKSSDKSVDKDEKK